jgi:hypothetical protein
MGNKNIFNKLPKYLWEKIFEYDPTYRIIYNNCLKVMIKKIREKEKKQKLYYRSLNYNILRYKIGSACLRYS